MKRKELEIRRQLETGRRKNGKFLSPISRRLLMVSLKRMKQEKWVYMAYNGPAIRTPEGYVPKFQ